MKVSDLSNSCPGASGLVSCEFIIHEFREGFMGGSEKRAQL